MALVNLIPMPRRQARQRARRVRVWISACSIYGVLLVGTYGVINATLGQAGRDLKDELQSVSSEIQVTQAKVAVVTPQVREVSLTLAASRAVGSQPDWSILLALLGDELGDNVVLSSVRIEPTTDLNRVVPAGSAVAQRYTLHVAGVGREHKAVLQYVLSLEMSGLFDRVTSVGANRAPFGKREGVSFRLDCEFGSR